MNGYRPVTEYEFSVAGTEWVLCGWGRGEEGKFFVFAQPARRCKKFGERPDWRIRATLNSRYQWETEYRNCNAPNKLIDLVIDYLNEHPIWELIGISPAGKQGAHGC